MKSSQDIIYLLTTRVSELRIMPNRISAGLMISFAVVLLIYSCKSEQQKTAELVDSMTADICNMEGTGKETLSSEDPANSVVTGFKEPIEKSCHCLVDIIGHELKSRFTYGELEEIRKDNVKQLMVLQKIMENDSIQAAVQACIEEKVTDPYNEFGQELDKKFSE